MTTRIVRHASKKATTSDTFVSKLCSFNNFIETDFDQPINYSLLYAEENSVIEEIGFFEYLAGGSEQENTVTTYYTEGTPFETPVFFSTSTSTSTSDLLLDDIKVNNTIQAELKEYITTNQTSDIKDKLEKSKETSQLKSYMEFENKDKECENTDVELYLPDDTEDSDDRCDEERLERIINVTPSQSPIELCEKDQEGRVVNFEQQTPLMFSRCSSLGSLSGCEQQSIHDDHSSVVSDFSRRTSEVVSPSELPDSPALQTPSGSSHLRDKKLGRRKIQSQRCEKLQSDLCPSQQEVSKRSIFEDDLAVFEEESTPVKFQSAAASSLSSLTIDDDDVDERNRGEGKSKARVIKSLKTPATTDQFDSNDDEKRKAVNNVESFEGNAYISVDEEQILDEYIRKGIAKVTRQHINDVSSFNLQANSTYEANDESNPEKLCNNACRSLELFDENSELTAEEERLLDECIRRGIAKVTRQNIDDVTSLSLRSNPSGHSSCSKSDKQEKEQSKHEKSEDRSAVYQTEQ